jgi:lipopolysaccharide transport system permease protein
LIAVSALSELWKHRGIIRSLVVRDVTARYKQSFLGPLWALLQPLALMGIFTVVTSFVSVPSEGYPYPLFTYAALLPWTMFTSAVGLATPSIAMNASLIKKIYFPREILPLSAVLVSVFDFLMAFAVLLGLMLYYGVAPTVWMALLPGLLLLHVAFSLGVGLFSCAIGTFNRDVIFVAVFVLQLWMFASPVIYPLSAVPAEWKSVYLLNPMAGLVESFRSVLLGKGPPEPAHLVPAAIGSVLALVLGYLLFKALERYYADVV